MRINRHLFKCFLLALIVASTNAYSGTLLMKIPGINGEYQGEGFKGWIKIYSFSGAVISGGCESFYSEKLMDSTSPAIVMSAALATPFAPGIEIIDRESTAEVQYTASSFLLNNAVITSVSLGGTGNSDFNESLAITPDSLTLNVYNEDGDILGSTNVACGKDKAK